jgi:hypothetical protein
MSYGDMSENIVQAANEDHIAPHQEKTLLELAAKRDIISFKPARCGGWAAKYNPETYMGRSVPTRWFYRRADALKRGTCDFYHGTGYCFSMRMPRDVRMHGLSVRSFLGINARTLREFVEQVDAMHERLTEAV